jgi:DNA-binding NarL/FixJ family response regulator
MNHHSTSGLVTATAKVVADLFTPRERDILAGLAFGLSNRDIATQLCLTEKTVKNRVTGILKKLEAKNRTQAAAWALRHGVDGKELFQIEEST